MTQRRTPELRLWAAGARWAAAPVLVYGFSQNKLMGGIASVGIPG